MNVYYRLLYGNSRLSTSMTYSCCNVGNRTTSITFGIYGPNYMSQGHIQIDDLDFFASSIKYLRHMTCQRWFEHLHYSKKCDTSSELTQNYLRCKIIQWIGTRTFLASCLYSRNFCHRLTKYIVGRQHFLVLSPMTEAVPVQLHQGTLDLHPSFLSGQNYNPSWHRIFDWHSNFLAVKLQRKGRENVIGYYACNLSTSTPSNDTSHCELFVSY